LFITNNLSERKNETLRFKGMGKAAIVKPRKLN